MTSHGSSPSISERGPDLRIDLDPEQVGRGLAHIVVAVLELLRELLERQAIRRVDAGDLDPMQIERLGSALLELRRQLTELSTSLDEPGRDPMTGLLDKTVSFARTAHPGKESP